MIQAIFVSLRPDEEIFEKEIAEKIKKKALKSSVLSVLRSSSLEFFKKDWKDVEIRDKVVTIAGSNEPLQLFVAVVSDREDPVARVLSTELLDSLSHALISFPKAKKAS